jgi:protoheme IX farnesyltransferase
VLPNTAGERTTRRTIVFWTIALVATSLLVVPLGVAHRGFLIAAALLGSLLFAAVCSGPRSGSERRWARSLFAISIVYLVSLFAALAIDP